MTNIYEHTIIINLNKSQPSSPPFADNANIQQKKIKRKNILKLTKNRKFIAILASVLILAFIIIIGLVVFLAIYFNGNNLNYYGKKRIINKAFETIIEYTKYPFHIFQNPCLNKCKKNKQKLNYLR
jgi:hypothetical protein